jgi:hypothetical protein
VKGFDCSSSDFSTTVHELGHAFGLGHASFESSIDGSITNYGMTNDVMGGGTGEDHFVSPTPPMTVSASSTI